MSASIDDPHVFPAHVGGALPALWRGVSWHAVCGVAQRTLRRLGHVAVGLLVPALLLALWWTAAERHWVPEQLLSPPALVWQSLSELWASGELQDHLKFSASRVAWSLLIGGSVGLLLGFGMALSRTLRAYFYPTFTVVAQFPVLGWIPLLIIFAGIDEALKISAISIAVVVPVALNALKGIAQIPPSLIEVSRVFRFTPAQTVLRVVLPATAPSLFTGLRQAVMQAWLSLVFVELLASSEGIGYLIVWGRQLAQPDLIVAGMVVIGIVGVLLDLSLRWAEASLQGWRRTAY
ncbi:MAG: ABC transporter permease [Pseudomonadota bacterium]